MATRSPQDIARSIQELESEGYQVRRKVEYVKRGFQIEKELLERLNRCTLSRGIRVKDAINQAISQWIDACEATLCPDDNKPK